VEAREKDEIKASVDDTKKDEDFKPEPKKSNKRKRTGKSDEKIKKKRKKSISREAKEIQKTKEALVTFSALLLSPEEEDEKEIVCKDLKRNHIMNFKIFTKIQVKNVRSTHLIINQSNRTLKVIEAISLGLWIVRYEWLKASRDKNKWVNEEDYECNDWFQGCRESRLINGTNTIMKKELSPSLFEDKTFVFYGEFDKQNEKWCTKIVKNLNGTVTTFDKYENTYRTLENKDKKKLFHYCRKSNKGYKKHRKVYKRQ